MMMKNPIILVTCVLLLSSLVASESSAGPDDCCFEFYASRLPKNRVVTYKYTDKRCSKEAVIFTMKSGVKICADLSDGWAKRIIEAKEWNHTKRVNSTGSKQSN